MRIESIQPYLSSGVLLIEYFVVHNQLIVFLVTQNSIEVIDLDMLLLQLQRLIRQWNFQLRKGLKMVVEGTHEQIISSLPKTQKVLNQFFIHLLVPFADRLQQYPQLIIVPHGPLHFRLTMYSHESAGPRRFNPGDRIMGYPWFFGFAKSETTSIAVCSDAKDRDR